MNDPRGDAPLGLLAAFSSAPVALAFVLSWLLPQSVWGPRHLIIVAVPYLLLAAAPLCRLRPRWASATALTLVGSWTLAAGALTLLRREPTYVRCAWDVLARRMARREPPAAGGFHGLRF